MKNKFVSIFLIMLLICTSLPMFSVNDANTLAYPGDGRGDGDDYLDFDYMWSTVNYLANIIYTAYNDTDIKKGRYFGSKGDAATAEMLYKNFTKECGFNESDVRKVKLQNIPDKPDTDYTEFVEVTSYQLHIDWESNFPFNSTIPRIDHAPVRAVRPEAGNFTEGDCSMQRTFQGVDVINENNFLLDFSKWDTGVNEKNMSFSTLNDCDLILGNLTYVAPEANVSAYQPFETIFLFDEAEGVDDKIDNATNSSGVILVSDDSKGYQFENASEYLIPIVSVDSEEENLTTIKQYLENDTRVVVDSMVFNDTLTFIHDMSGSLCWPNEDFVIVINKTKSPLRFWFVASVWVRNGFHPSNRCRGIILFDDETEHCHNVEVQNIKGIRMGRHVPLYALPGFSVNKTVGEFLWDNDDVEDNTISGHVHQTHYMETDEEPGVEAYNVEAYLNVTKSPGDAVVVISSRYDSMWNECSGDSGAGNGIIMGVAKYMQKLNQEGVKPKYNITFLMTTNEENGMYGAQFFNDSHPNDNIKMWIGTDQLGFNTGHLHNVYRNHTHRNICENITKLLDYEVETGYEMFHNTTDDHPKYDVLGWLDAKYGVGAEDVVFYERNNPYKCDTILVHKSGFPNHHKRGLGLTDGDVLDNMDKVDVNMFYNISWDIVKYFVYNPDCGFSNVEYTPFDSPDDGDTLDDSVNVSFSIDSVLPHDTVMVMVNVTKFTPDPPSLTTELYATFNYTVTISDNTRYFIYTIPDDIDTCTCSFDLRLYNSTDRINAVAGVGECTVDDVDGSDDFTLYHPFGYPTAGGSYQVVEDNITGAVFTIHEYGIADNLSVCIRTTAFPPAPTYQGMIYRVNDSKLMGVTDNSSSSKSGGPGDPYKWITLNFTGNIKLSKDTEYILTVWGDNSNAKVYYDDFEDQRGRFNNSFTYDTSPNQLNFTNTSRLYSIYCSYTPDTTLPEITNVTSIPINTGYYDTDYEYYTNITADVTDNISGVNTVTVAVDYPNNTLMGNYTMTTGTDDTFWYNLSMMNTPYGIYNYTVWAEDRANNSNTSAENSFNVSICGDANGDGSCNIGDSVFLINYTFKSGPPPDPLCAGDANGDGDVNSGDAVYIINFVLQGGDPPKNTCCPLD